MIANSIAYVISRRFQRVPIFEVLAEQDGVHLPSMEEARELRVPVVEDAMRTTLMWLSARETIGNARACMDGMSAAVPLALPGGEWAVVTPADLVRLDDLGHGAETLGSTFGPEARVATVHRDQSLDTALRLLRDRPLLPVVHRADPSRLEGVLALEDILRAYRR